MMFPTDPNPDEILDENENDAMMCDYLSHKTPDMDIIKTSDCCGVPPKGISIDMGLCPMCGDHCTYGYWDENGEEIDEDELRANHEDLPFENISDEDIKNGYLP